MNSQSDDKKTTDSDKISNDGGKQQPPVFMGNYKHRKHKGKTEDENDFPIITSSGHSFGNTRRHKKKKKMKTWKKVTIAICSVVLALVLVVTGVLGVLIYNGSQEMVPTAYDVTAPTGVEVEQKGEVVHYNGEDYEINKNITAILFIGVDRNELGQTSETSVSMGQADAILLCAVDTSTGKTTIINVSREIITDVDTYSKSGKFLETVKQQLCLSYGYLDGKEKSCENTQLSVQRLFYNFPINAYFALDLDGIAAINDSVGGVDVISPETIGEFEKGTAYHLMGKQAELFVRKRDTTQLESNNARNKRQQVYIKSFISTVADQTKQDISTPVKLFNASSDYSCTNLNASKISYLAADVVTSGGMTTKIKNVPGKIQMGEYSAEYIVDEEKFYDMFLGIFYKKVS